MRSLTFLLLAAALSTGSASLVAQAAAPAPVTEQVSYKNAKDGASLTGALMLPAAPGPHPGVVLLTLAGADALTARLNGLGYAVLIPERRGMLAVEMMLQATFQDLADDVQAGVDYLRARPEVGAADVTLIGQGEDSPAAIIAAYGSPDPLPLILLAPPAFPGTETLQLEQHGLAESRGYGRLALDSLDAYVAGLAQVVLAERSAALREQRVYEFMTKAGTGLPRSANFPVTMEGQSHFFGSAWWWDRLSFDPIPVLQRVESPVLVMIGLEDPFTDLPRYFPTMQRALQTGLSQGATLCTVEGRTRHEFSPVVVDVVTGWLAQRTGGSWQRVCIDPRGLR